MTGSSTVLDSARISLDDLTQHGDAPALVTATGVLSYADLANKVRKRAATLGAVRRLVMLVCSNDAETVVTYLAALVGGHPVLLTADGVDGHRADLVAAYRPDVVAAGDVLHQHWEGTRHNLHPELAVLLSTSGSTGSPKLVRLSSENLRSNATSIATYLGITRDDRAVTTLPLHYCYGLSVLNSHLLAGASVLLTDRSVLDEELWEKFRNWGATSFAGVPHTFDLLDASTFAERHLPSLRYVTQAGGRMSAEKVRRYVRLGRERGFDFVVMYGQTEATARMAYLPPHLAEDRPEAIGIPIPGGTFRIDTEEGTATRDGVGELVYTGPNVMLGYATARADLALGRTLRELRTGDLARQHEDGIYEVVGRRSRFAKIYGLRIDLDRFERLTAERGVLSRAVERDGQLVAFVTRRRSLEKLGDVAVECGLPRHAVLPQAIDTFPLTATGKPDYAAMTRHAALVGQEREKDHPHERVSAADVRALYAELLGRPDATERDTFVSLRGDSLSYVEVSIRLGDLLGRLPTDWANRSACDLAPGSTRPRSSSVGRSWWSLTETSSLLRAVAIILVVATHANVITVMGGAHLMLGVTGFNLARFQLSDQPRSDRVHGLLRAAGQVVVPSAIWILGVSAVNGMYQPWTAFMLNSLLGSGVWDVQWQFWFLEAVVWSQIAVAGLMFLPLVDRLERQQSYRFALTVLVAALGARYALVGVSAGSSERYALPVVIWCIALGWLVARSDTVSRRYLTSVWVAVSTYGFFDDHVRESLVAAGLLLLTWTPQVLIPRALASTVSVLAGSSLFVYLTHWQVYPHLEMDHPIAATVASFAVGIASWKIYTLAKVRLSKRRVNSQLQRAVGASGGDAVVPRPRLAIGQERGQAARRQIG